MNTTLDALREAGLAFSERLEPFRPQTDKIINIDLTTIAGRVLLALDSAEGAAQGVCVWISQKQFPSYLSRADHDHFRRRAQNEVLVALSLLGSAAVIDSQIYADQYALRAVGFRIARN